MSDVKKTLYHGAFRDLGQVHVKVLGEPQPSKFKKDGVPPFFIKLEIQGAERQYTPENDACVEFFRGKAGQTLLVQAEGQRDDASFKLLGQPASKLPPKPAAPPQQTQPQRPPPPDPSAPKRVPQDTAAVTPEQSVKRMKHFVGQNATLAKAALRCMCDINWLFYDEFGTPMPEPLQVAVYQTCLYGSERAGVIAGLPAVFDIQLNSRQQQGESQ